MKGINDVCAGIKGLIENAEARGRILNSVQIYREEMNMDDSSIISRIMEKFNLSQQAAELYVFAEK